MLLKPALLFIRLIPSWFTHKQPCIKSKKPEAPPLQKTDEACFRFCPRCGNNPFNQLMADYLAKKNLTSPG
ncbi:hypothetical protein [Klebsiella michiganensis]|uniref:hypothetical protein n=1 Tax=Klebsiella michiganensis TaxID=1134687 RepID=UPI003D98A762